MMSLAVTILDNASVILRFALVTILDNVSVMLRFVRVEWDSILPFLQKIISFDISFELLGGYMEKYIEYILKPFTDPIAVTFAIIIGIVFLAGFVQSLFSSRGLSPFSRYAPTALTTIGVVGTFTGIYFGLVDFDVDKINESIPNLLDGLKIAFSTSIMGMVASIVLKLIQGTRRSKTEKEIVSASDIYKVMTDVRDETKGNRERSEELLLEVKGAISGDGDSSLVTQIQKLRTSTQDGNQETKKVTTEGFESLNKATIEGFDRMNEEFRIFAEKMAENNSKALIEALQEVIRDFNTKITEQFGDNFKQLNEAVGALLTWQETYKDQVEAMIEQFSEVQKGITDTRDAVTVIGEQSKEIPVTMSELRNVIQVADNQIEQLNSQLEAIAALREKAVSAFPIIEENLDKLTTEFSKAVTHHTELISGMLDGQSTAMRETAAHNVAMLEKSTQLHEKALDNLEAGIIAIPKEVDALISKLDTELSGAMNTFTTEIATGLQGQSSAIAESLDGMRESMQRNLTDTNDVIQQSFQVFDQQMQEEIQRTIETMGSHLASLSNKFVEDYTPLTDKLRKVVEMSRTS